MPMRRPRAGQAGREPESAFPTPSAKRRRRPPLACFQCRKRKVKCDQEKPCNNCTKAKILDCTFPAPEIPGLQGLTPDGQAAQAPGPGSTSSAPLDSPIAQDPSIFQDQRLRNRLPEVEPVIDDRTTSSTPLVTDLSTLGRDHHVPQSPHGDLLLQRIRELETTVKKLSSNGSLWKDSDQAQNQAGVASDVTSGLRFGNQSAWINGTSLFSNVLQPLGQAQHERSQLHDAITNFQALGGQIDQHFAMPNPPMAVRMRIPEKGLADNFLDNYFTHFEGWLRVLHIPSFRSEYERFWQQRDSVSEIFVLQLEVCMALGVTADRDCLNWKNAASQWLLEGRRWLQESFDKAKKKPSLEELQLACLILIADANASENDQMFQCWVSAGQLVRRSMSSGLHREPQGMRPVPSDIQAEMRRRLWATVLELNLILSLQAGQPTLISASDYDIQAPSNLSDEELSNKVDEGGLSHFPGSNTSKQMRTTPQLALFDSFRLRSDLVDKLNGIGQTMSYDEVLQFHADLCKAKRKMQESFRANSTPPTTTNYAHHSIANIILSRYLLALHLPVLGRSIKNPAFHFSRRFCIAASIEMIKVSGILGSGQQASPQVDDGVQPSLKRLFVNSPGLFRHVVIQAIFAIALELVTSKEEEQENLGVFPAWDTAELFQCLRAAETWGADRLHAGITDHRGYCFMGACLAYAQSLESGGAPAENGTAVVEAASKNAENCSRIMREVAHKLGVPVDQATRTTGALNVSTLFPEGMDVTLDLTSSFFGVGMDGFAFDWTYPLDLGLGSSSV